jgi:integrase
MINKTTTQIVIDKRTKKKDGTFPIKIRVTNDGTNYKYGIGESATEEDFEKVMSAKPRGEYKAKKLVLDVWEQKAINIIDGMDVFTFEEFKTEFKGTPKSMLDLIGLFDNKVQELRKNEQIGTAISYQYALVSLRKYKPNIKLKSINKTFLEGYERWFIAQGNSITTLGIYCRNLRSIINIAIEKGLLDQKQYPFAKGQYVIPKKNKLKKSLDKSQLAKIYNYKSDEEESILQKARDFSILMYLCNGCNTHDLLAFRKENIKGDYIEFTRQKTKLTTKHNLKTISIFISPEIKELINRYGSIDSQGYLIDFLHDGMSAEDIKKAVGNFNRVFNSGMKKLASDLGISITARGWNYVMRHTYFSMMLAGGADLYYLQEAAGHQSIDMTIGYIKTLDTKKKELQSNQLLNFA